jgi:hypothetical protein
MIKTDRPRQSVLEFCQIVYLNCTGINCNEFELSEYARQPSFELLYDYVLNSAARSVSVFRIRIRILQKKSFY